MKKLIDKFYSYSPFKRIVIGIITVLIISSTMVGYSLYSLSVGLREFWNVDAESINKERKLVTLSEVARRANSFISPDVINAIKEYDKLAILANKYMQKITLDGINATISDKQIAEIDKIIENTKFFKMQHCLLFANTYMHLTRSMALNLIHIRQIVRFLVKYSVFKKNKNPNFDITDIVQSIEKLNRLMQTSTPYLLGKMLTIAASNINVKNIHSQLSKGKLSATEAIKVLSVLKNSYSILQNFKQSMKNEFLYFQQFRGAAYIKAPLACWLIDLTYGDPSKKYMKYISEEYSKDEWLKIMNKEKHLFFAMLLPNYRLAQEKNMASLALQTIICQELADYAGLNETFKDPYMPEHNLRSIQKDGRKVYYAVGSDKIGNECQGDDIWFKDEAKVTQK